MNERSVSSPIGVAALAGGLLLGSQALADWPQWGGPDRDFTVEAATPVEPWPEAGPPTLWRRDFEPGYSAVVVRGDLLITMVRRGDREVVVAVSMKTGKTLWEHAYPAAALPDPTALDTSYGAGPNSTPLIGEHHVVSLGFTGVLTCVRLEDGKPVWVRNLADDGVQPPYFGHASSPLRHGDTVIVVAGGAHAFDLETGEPRWRNTSFDATYASPILTQGGSRTLLLVPAAGTVVGVDPDNGDTLWRHEHANQHRTILSSPVASDDGWIFVSAYYVGSIGLQLNGDGTVATERWANPRLQISHSNAVRDGDFVYGFHNSILTAVDIKTGEIGWRHRGIKKANLLKVGSRFLLLDNLGRLLLASFNRDGVTVLADSQILRSRAWTVPTVDDGTLIVRTEDTLMALDLTGTRHVPGKAVATAKRERAVQVSEVFMKARRQLSAAIYAGDVQALEASRTAFVRLGDGGNPAHLVHYFAGVAAWEQMLLSEGQRTLVLLDLAVDHLKAALAARSDFADAHARLSAAYSAYYRLDRGRAAVIGPKGDEHLGLALLEAPRNPRVVAAEALDLLNSPAQYGGDRQAGLKRFREALSLFATSPAENSTAGPDEGHAMAWWAYGKALLAGAEPDRDGARAAFLRALEIEPRFVAARVELEQFGGGS